MKFLKPLPRLGAAVLLLGLLLHATVADKSGVLRGVFYALPWPLMAVGWLAVALLWDTWHLVRLACVFLAVGCAGWWYAASHPPPRSSPGVAPTLKVVSWNMAHQKLPSADLKGLLETLRPDVAGLVEVGARHGDPAPLVDSLPPGYSAQKLDNALAIVVRGSCRLLQETRVPTGSGISKFAHVEAVVDGTAWHIFLVDGVSNPIASRADFLSQVLSEARGHPRTIVFGDFNTPLESAFFDPWRATFHHAFGEAGGGFRETWPRWVPLLTIDHVWASLDLTPLRAEKQWPKSSDHAALVVELGR